MAELKAPNPLFDVISKDEVLVSMIARIEEEKTGNNTKEEKEIKKVKCIERKEAI